MKSRAVEFAVNHRRTSNFDMCLFTSVTAASYKKLRIKTHKKGIDLVLVCRNSAALIFTSSLL